LSLFENDGQAFFTDQAHAAGMADASLLYLTFGLFFFDYDLDGRQDALTANGHIDNFVRSYNTLVAYKERQLLFHNLGNGRFEEVGKPAGFTEDIVGRGMAFGDYDNDGDLDVAV